jgi:ATP-dependent 26S proteasome regulatory subunit
MNVDPDVNYDELARCTDDFNGAQCKAVCVEAGTSKLETKTGLKTSPDKFLPVDFHQNFTSI